VVEVLPQPEGSAETKWIWATDVGLGKCCDCLVTDGPRANVRYCSQRPGDHCVDSRLRASPEVTEGVDARSHTHQEIRSTGAPFLNTILAWKAGAKGELPLFLPLPSPSSSSSPKRPNSLLSTLFLPAPEVRPPDRPYSPGRYGEKGVYCWAE
jgi:hypothetical protein